MKPILHLVLISLVSVSCSTSRTGAGGYNSAYTSTTSNTDTGAYGSAYVPITANLKPTKEVTIHVCQTMEQYAATEKKFASLIKNNGWKVVGTATLYGSYYDTVKIENLARSKGADTVLINIGKTPTFKQKVAYGFGDYNQYNNYYGSPYIAPIIPPYQVAPAQGSMDTYMDYALKQQQYERGQQQMQIDRERLNALRSERQAQWDMEQRKWTQWLIFLRSPSDN